ncbi:hypothetical protein SAMN02949497_3333 [Methylomagnum ishizawai]|uniref:Lipoprotein n=1 Tax=Methylomagnum ishizawai TaxID=1760988 RepID=A0A1Y6D803_9GAMM|nr:hypothetical protein [Methylomagnum ishizawai]SMF95955.1 hypothetical protein SAMN02949497_3333 [Methylomagnum ishizawai]
MMRFARLGGMAGLAWLLAACAQFRDSDTRLTENHLFTAGFKIMEANTPERQGMLNGLAPETLTRVPRPEAVYYIYADPDICSCLYVGRETEFDKLQALLRERQDSDRRMVARELEQDQRLGWGPGGPWGNWGAGGNNAGRPDWDPH